MEEALKRIVIDLEPSAGEIAGRVRDANGEVRPFSGWMELAAAIEAAHDRREFENEHD